MCFVNDVYGWHGPLAQNDLDLDASRRDHEPIGSAPGKPRGEGVGRANRLVSLARRAGSPADDVKAYRVANKPPLRSPPHLVVLQGG
jgi:hypothetical protein